MSNRGTSKLTHRLVQIQEQTQTQSALQVLTAKLTELPLDALKECVENVLVENPYLEATHTGGEESLSTSSDQTDYSDDQQDADYGIDQDRPIEYDASQDYSSEDDVPDFVSKGSFGLSAMDIASETIPVLEQQSLYDQLMEQAKVRPVSERERVILEHLISALDENGMLKKSFGLLCDELSVYHDCDTSTDELEHVLELLQTFDPAGVGARSLQECLILQYIRKHPQKHEEIDLEDLFKTRKVDRETTLLRVLTRCWEELSQNRWDLIKARYELTDKKIQSLRNELRTLNPRLGSIVTEAPRTPEIYMYPDVSITVDSEGTIDYNLNEMDIPQLSISTDADSMMDNSFVQDYVKRGQMFMLAILQRRKTIMLTIEALIKKQRKYLLTGDEQNLKPMTMEDLAQMTGLALSTISRACNAKYVETPYGTHPIKWFFSASVKQNDGDVEKEVSVRKLQNLIKQYVDNEDKSHPLSDADLIKLVAEHGFDIARRTMSSYREQLAIPSSRLRKK